jgi:hypothetical protein
VNPASSETPDAQVSRWLGEGHATWGFRIGEEWAEFQLVSPDPHRMAAAMEQRLPERAS